MDQIFSSRIYRFFWILIVLNLSQLAAPAIKYYYKKKHHRPHNYQVLPKRLSNISFAEDDGIILATRKIAIKDKEFAHNGSLVRFGKQYLLAFRNDSPVQEKVVENQKFATRIGIQTLDRYFQPIGDPQMIETSSNCSEDPRLFACAGKIYLLFNDLGSRSLKKWQYRTMRVAELNLDRFNLQYITNLDLHLQLQDKNWIPFANQNDESSPFHLCYQINPHKVMKLSNPKENHLDPLLFPKEPCIAEFSWEEKWGKLRGGTPAIYVNGEYLAFFHSRFKDKETKLRWYVMGAYTFEASPPFRVTSISPYPILFHGIYQTKLNPDHCWNDLQCVYPAGIAKGKEAGKEVIHVSCGENDSAIKIITFDKEKLLKQMIRL